MLGQQPKGVIGTAWMFVSYHHDDTTL